MSLSVGCPLGCRRLCLSPMMWVVLLMWTGGGGTGHIACHWSRTHGYDSIGLIMVGATTNAAPTPNYPNVYAQNVFLAQLDTKTNTTLDQTVQGPISFFPSQWAGAPLPLSSRPDFLITISIMLPHIGDDKNACPSSGDWHTTNEFGQSFANSFVLIEKSTSCGNQFTHAQKAGVGGFLVYGCPAEAPYNCDPTLQAVYVSALNDDAQIKVPMISIKASDGQKLVQYLEAKRAEAIANSVVPAIDTLNITLKSSGPIVPAERAALIAAMNETTMTLFGNFPNDLAPPWSVERFSNMSLDPCLDRVFGIYCEGGHVVSIYIQYHFWTGPAPVELGQLTKMRFFSSPYNLWSGPLPDSYCNWTDLRGLIMTQQLSSGLTSIPNCDWPLIEELQFQVNALAALPTTFSNWTRLRAVYIANNQLTSLPSLLNFNQLTNFDVGSNFITGSLPAFSPVAPLTIVSFANNLLTGAIAPDLFNSRSSLSILDLNNNRLSGPLPNFVGCTSLTIVDLSAQRDINDLSPTANKGFTGSQPPSWSALTSMVKLHLQRNSLVSPFNTGVMYSLQELDLSYNYLTSDGDAKIVVLNLLSPAMISLRLSYNSLVGPWSSTDRNVFQVLKKLYLDHNQLTHLAPETFVFGITTLDASYNNLTSVNDDGAALDFIGIDVPPNNGYEYLNLQGNPRLQYDDVPSWMIEQSTKVQDGEDLYSCHTFKATTAPMLTILIDPTFHRYKHCDCAAGTFGHAPLCSHVPNTAVLNPFAVISSDEIGANLPTLIEETGGVGSQLTDPANSSLYVPSFSDSMYGENRLTLGISTSWVVNLQNLYADDPQQFGLAGETTPDPIRIYETSSKPSSMWTPVRMITIRFHISAAIMTQFDDLLSIYEGGSDLKGTRIYSIRGTDDKPTRTSSPYTLTSEYLRLHNESISQIQDPRLVETQVFRSEATVQFNSRTIKGLHFYATYSYDFQCPDGYFYDTTSDPSNPHCRLNYLIFEVGYGLRVAIFAVVALTLAFVTFNIIILLWKWDTLIYKAASRVFMLLILILLECMALGALLYAIIPSQINSIGNSICQGRAWLTCLPLLSLLAKRNFLSKILPAITLSIRE